MNCTSFITLFTLGLLLCVPTVADEPKEHAEVATIPLDQIWGYSLPDTRDIAGITLPETDPQEGVIGRTDAMFRRQREQNIEQLRRALTAKPPTERALPGFVLPRHPDFFTLQKASNRVAGMMQYAHEKRRFESETFRAGEDMTLVFFTHPASYYVRLRKVGRQDNEITVQYEFEPHASPEVTVHFALIPLGKLPAGEYQVRFEQIPLAQKYREAGFDPVEPDALTIVCRPFSFKMWEPADSAPAKDATSIPLDQIWAYDIPGARDMHELEPKPDPTLSVDEFARRSDIWKISKVLSRFPKEGTKAGSAFLVVGTGKEALTQAEAVFSSGKDTRNFFPPDSDLSLVFYSQICGRYVRITSVERSADAITVKYQFVAHQTPLMSKHFALIPIGKLPEGTYQVKIEQLEAVDEQGRPVAPMPDPRRFVSDSFSFTVRRE